MGMPTMARVVESEGSLAFRCGDCGAAVLDLRCGCPQCKVDLVGLLVDSSDSAGGLVCSAFSGARSVYGAGVRAFGAHSDDGAWDAGAGRPGED